MKRGIRVIARAPLILLTLVATCLSGCVLIDEDLGDCGTEYKMDYELKLITNITTELTTQFGLATDINVTAALMPFLQPVFTDYAHDVYLSFYDLDGDMPLLKEMDHIMDDNQSSYTLYIPIRDYMHLAVANLEENNSVTMESRDFCKLYRLQQEQKDTVESHTTGLFTARLPMHMKEGVNQHFDVSLYMANCASALVLDTLGSHVREIRAFAAGFATAFDMADSTYHFQSDPIVRAKEVKVEPEEDGNAPVCFSCVTFPSRMEAETKVIIETTDPFVGKLSQKALWNYRVYCTLGDGSITESLLGVYQPLHPGQLKVITARVLDTGECVPNDPYVGASVALNWNDQMSHDIEL